MAALEFALIVPLLLALYFVTMEVAQAIETNKKVGRIGAMVADLVTQMPEINESELDGIMRIGEATLQPYNRSQPNITITAIEVTDEATPKIQVVWSHKLIDGEFEPGPAKGTAIIIPPALRIKDSFLVRAESTLAYEPVITWAASAEGHARPCRGLRRHFRWRRPTISGPAGAPPSPVRTASEAPIPAIRRPDAVRPECAP